MCPYDSFLSFFHNLLSSDSIPLCEFQVVIHYDGHISGKYININDNMFSDPVFEYLRTAKKTKIVFTSLMHEYTFTWETDVWNYKKWSRTLP